MRYLEIHENHRPPRRHELERDLFWIGSARNGTLAERDAAKSGAQAAELLPDERGVRIQLLPRAPFRLTAAGVVGTSANVAWGDEVFFDDVRLTFVEDAGRGRRGLVAAVALAAVALAVVLLVPGGPQSSALTEPVAAPRFEPGRAACSAAGAGVEARAFEADRLGRAKRERYAFAGKDGVEALPLLREAVACFRDAGRIQDAQRVQAALADLCERLNVDVLSLGLTLSAALERERFAEALRTVRKLQALVGTGRTGAYAEWLDRTRRDLEGKLSHPQKSATR
jgi:hypothetical protein